MKPMTIEWWLEFFKRLEDTFPPASGRHHVICRTEQADDNFVLKQKLTLHIGTQTFFLDEEDLNKSIDELMAEVTKIMEDIDEGK